MKKLLLILLCLPIVVCASFPIPSVVDTPVTDTLINIKTITPKSADTLKSNTLYSSDWMIGEEKEKISFWQVILYIVLLVLIIGITILDLIYGRGDILNAILWSLLESD